MTNTQDSKPVEILLVEDNPGDIRLTQEAFKEGNINNQIHVTKDGNDALDFVYQRGEYTDAVRPDIILLDLNLPRKNGDEVLEEIKADPDLKQIPVVVLTTSAADEDILNSYKLHTNAYLTKPVDPDEFIDLIRSFEDFWLELVKLPAE